MPTREKIKRCIHLFLYKIGIKRHHPDILKQIATYHKANLTYMESLSWLASAYNQKFKDDANPNSPKEGADKYASC
jgi:hypothetical protein